MDLGSLGVSIESHSSFEQRVLAKAAAAAAKAEAEVANQLKEKRGLLVSNMETVKKKLNSPAYSAALQQEMLTSQLKILEKQLEELDRVANRTQDASTVLEPGSRGADETERERLIRTGFITPFAGIDGSERKRLITAEPSAGRKQPLRAPQVSNNSPRVHTNERANQYVSRNDDKVPRPTNREEPAASARRDKRKRKRSHSSKPKDADDGDEESFQERMHAVQEGKKKKKRKSRERDGEGAECSEEDGLDEDDASSDSDQEDVQFSGGFRVPKSIYDQLFPYQRTAVKWMWELHCQEAGGIVGDEMGLGKTVQTVAFLAGLHRSGLLEGPVLLLCPATIMAQWVRHFHEWYPPLRVVVVHDSGSHARAAHGGEGRRRSAERLVREAFRRGGVVVTTYDHLRIHADLMTSKVPP